MFSTFCAASCLLACACGCGGSGSCQLSRQLGSLLPVLAEVLAHDALPPLLPHGLPDAPVLPHLSMRNSASVQPGPSRPFAVSGIVMPIIGTHCAQQAHMRQVAKHSTTSARYITGLETWRSQASHGQSAHQVQQAHVDESDR